MSMWNGFEKTDLEVGGRESFLIFPKVAREDHAWVWRTEFFGAFDYADRALLDKGWVLAYHRVSDMYGDPESVGMLREFYEVVTEKYGLSKRPVLFGFSRGGLYAVNFALQYPDSVGALYLDAPVCDLRSWPGGLFDGEEPTDACLAGMMARYHIPDIDALRRFEGSPAFSAGELALAGIPVLIVAGDSDRTVPFDHNGRIFAERFVKADPTADILVMLKPGCDHHPHSLADPEPIVAWIERHRLPG